MIYFKLSLFFISSLILSFLFLPLLLNLLEKREFFKPNFEGKQAICSSGFLFIFIFLCFEVVYLLFLKNHPFFYIENNLAFFILILGFGILGFFDDIFGEKEIAGFCGHFRALFQERRLTTGMIKAGGGLVLALSVAVLTSKNIWDLIVSALIICLCANLFNLLDFRPGRALKYWLLFFIILFIFTYQNNLWIIGFVFIGSALLLLMVDLAKKAMLGDIGANVIGAVIGFFMVVLTPMMVKVIILAILVILNLITEKFSLNSIIEKFPPLRWFDYLGRR